MQSGFGAGSLSGFFGIGGGFLIVPGLMFATGMPIFNAIGSSLVGVAAFGATAAFNYAISGFVDWRLALVFIGGGIAGGLIGGRVARKVGEKRGALNVLLAAIISRGRGLHARENALVVGRNIVFRRQSAQNAAQDRRGL